MLPVFIFVIFLVSSSSTLSLNDLFPYGSTAGDSTMDSRSYNISEGPFRLPYLFPYFDDVYRQIWITKNGLFSFNSPSYFISEPRPLDIGSYGPLVAGFWHQQLYSLSNGTRNNVYYQIHSNRSLSSTVTAFDKASSYVRNFFPQHRPFIPKMVIIGTWYDIGVDTNDTDRLNNTFQIVLCTDEDRSFAFFLYHELQWSEPYNTSYSNAQAGFHNGERNISQALPYSGTEDIVKLVDESNVNVPGLFAYRIDADKINAGGCNDTVSGIFFRPRTGSQLGSTALSISGPCFTNTTKVKCRFNSSSVEIVNGLVLNEFRAMCLTPFASVHGPMPVSISIDDGQTFILAGNFTYAPLQFDSDEVTVETDDGNKLLNIGLSFTLKWHFSEIIKNTFANGTKIDIELWKVSLNQQSQLEKSNTPVILAQNLALTDSTRVQIPASITDISTCFIRVVARFNSQKYTGLNTGLLIIRSHRASVPNFDSKKVSNIVLVRAQLF